MRTSRNHKAGLIIVIGLALSTLPACAQYLPAPGHIEEVSVSIEMGNTRIKSGTSPIVSLKIRNTSSTELDISYSFESLPHIEGENGEPAKTLYHRQRSHEPGLPELRVGPGGDIGKPLMPGESLTTTMNLARFYALNTPGKYAVYIEMKDKFGKSVRTNSVQFEILTTTE